MTSSRTHARVPSPQLLPKEWYQPSAQPDSSSSYYSQPAGQDLGPSTSAKTRDKEQQKPRKAHRSSKLDGIPKDQMQRFRVVNLEPEPSSSGTKRTRSPGSDALPDARKGKSKAGLSLDKKEVAAKRKKEANRVQAYRDQLDDVYAELRALLYPDEENPKLAPPNHGKIQCIRDALERLKNSDTVWQQKEARLEAEIRRLKTLVTRYQEKEREWDAERSGYRQEIGATNELVGYLQRCLEAKHNQN
ncbi:hypothetical protein EWM64_g6154 [Hericium alpestre]|uniref:BHLH domain-containing protein n=1 Tax=Hericium alpestre TaxID=135208 RepID=A0A4Y9ZUX4_9AGAM|nr:hypothetical protein EWM64_g6154 [Hericium alpestre]